MSKGVDNNDPTVWVADSDFDEEVLSDSSKKLTCVSFPNKCTGWMKEHPKKARLLLAAVIIVGIIGASALGIHLGMGFEQFGHWFNQAALPWLKANAIPLEIAASTAGGFILGGIAIKVLEAIKKSRGSHGYEKVA